MSQPVVWFEVLGNEPEKLHRFYRELFDWKLAFSGPPTYGMVDNPKEGIPGGVGPVDDAAHRVTFYVKVDDLAAALKRATELGGKKVMTPRSIGDGGSIASFADPEGNVIGLVCQPAA